ncbi:MAG TPA: WbqC family protein [Kiritimatiellia bacterium]|nr:WbqC family protein [Kiritimatiellia bacterium]
MKKVAILQSNYIPWKGYFDLIRRVDEFILYDEMQYTKNDWRNRNLIKTPRGTLWLTIPVVQNCLHQKISETKIADPRWAKKHMGSLQMNYARAPHFPAYASRIFETYSEVEHEPFLSRVNFAFIRSICNWLGIRTKITWASDYELADGKTERLVDLCRQTGATDYISGPAAKNYLKMELFERADIRVHWMDYSNYAEYAQLFPPFVHGVSILDLIFNVGERAAQFF